MSPNYCKCHQAEIGAGISCSASHSKRKCQWMAMSKTLWIFNGKYSLCSIDLSIQYNSSWCSVHIEHLKAPGVQTCRLAPGFWYHLSTWGDNDTHSVISIISAHLRLNAHALPCFANGHISHNSSISNGQHEQIESMHSKWAVEHGRSVWNRNQTVANSFTKHIQCTHLEKHWVICDIQPEIEPPDQALPLRDTSLHGLTDLDRSGWLRFQDLSGQPCLFFSQVLP